MHIGSNTQLHFPSGNSALVPFQSFSSTRFLRHEISVDLGGLDLGRRDSGLHLALEVDDSCAEGSCSLELNQLRGMKDVNYQVTTMMP